MNRTAMLYAAYRITIGSLLTLAGAAAAESLEPETFFETQIRPVLATRCVSCHSPEKSEGATRLDTRDGLAASVEGGGRTYAEVAATLVGSLPPTDLAALAPAAGDASLPLLATAGAAGAAAFTIRRRVSAGS